MNIKITMKSGRKIIVDNIIGYKSFREFANQIRIEKGSTIFNDIMINTLEIESIEEIHKQNNV